MDAPAITLADDALRVTCTPAHGFSLTSFVDVESGADALWRRPDHAQAACSREDEGTDTGDGRCRGRWGVQCWESWWRC